jgi:hypothetical protein
MISLVHVSNGYVGGTVRIQNLDRKYNGQNNRNKWTNNVVRTLHNKHRFRNSCSSPVLSSFMTYNRFCNKRGTSGAGIPEPVFIV